METINKICRVQFKAQKSKITGLLLVVYSIIVPFFCSSKALVILPLALVYFIVETRSPWKVSYYSVPERVGDIASLLVIFALGYLQELIPVNYTNGINEIAQPIIGIVILDFVSYCIHRLAHHVKWLWAFHRVHHSLDCPRLINSSYEHITDALFRLVGPGLVLIALGFNEQTIVITSLVSSLFGMLSHLNSDVNFPTWVLLIFVTPWSHRVHHDRNLIDKNCGAITHIWDHLFGTYEMFELPQSDYGLKETEQISKGPWNIFKLRWKKILRPFKKSKSNSDKQGDISSNALTSKNASR